MKKLGLALGVGGAPATAHIGVIKALEEAEIQIDYIAGSSMGSLVGGLYAAGCLKEFEAYLETVTWKNVLSQFDPTVMKNGMFKGEKIVKFLDEMAQGKKIENCYPHFISIATDLSTGAEVRINKGKVSEAIRASIGIPGIFTTLAYKKFHLLDGGIINPLPIDVTREMGADVVLAVDLTKNYIHLKKPQLKTAGFWPFRLKYPTMIDALEGSIFTMQKLLTEKNLKEYPADIVLNLKLTPIGFFEFHKTKKLIEESYEATKKIIPPLRKLLKF